AADELGGGEAQEVQVDPGQPWQPPVLRGARDQAVDALERRAHTVDQLAREGPRLGVLGRVEVLPEEAQAGRLRRSVVEQIDLVERLEGQLARGSTRSHRQNFCTARRTCTISSAVTAASYPLLPASPPARPSARAPPPRSPSPPRRRRSRSAASRRPRRLRDTRARLSVRSSRAAAHTAGARTLPARLRRRSRPRRRRARLAPRARRPAAGRGAHG